jgi:CBS domain-containing protein
MLCSEVMKRDIECVSPQTSMRDAARRMRDRNIGFLPVCDELMHAVGTITDRDIAVRAVAEQVSAMAPVQACMTHEVIACSPDDDVGHARELMELHQKSRIICTGRNGRIEGIISLSDIADLDERTAAHTLRQVSQREAGGASHISPAL